MQRKRKRSMTLLEVMIVIFIIGIISSFVGYNMKGSLTRAKAFKTVEGMKKIKEIFELEIAQGSATLEDISVSPHEVLEGSGLVSNSKEMLKDGWGKPYDIKVNSRGNIVIKSSSYDQYQSKQKKKHQDEVAFSEEENEEDL
jgi:prepilin-type N-terminal cleavage/methylation domain-containing protein